MQKGGVYAYVDVYRYFTETSGLGLTAQASKLINPDPVKREEDVSDQVEEWVQKCGRLARHGTQYELAPMYKTVALGKLLIGETKRVYEAWQLEGLPYEKLLAKLRDYSRSKRLDGEAKRGKQAVDLNASQDNEASWGDQEE